jgi:hypothetical protein
LSNKTYTVLIENCRLKHDVEFDHGEDLATRLVPVAEIVAETRRRRKNRPLPRRRRAVSFSICGSGELKVSRVEFGVPPNSVG